MISPSGRRKIERIVFLILIIVITLSVYMMIPATPDKTSAAHLIQPERVIEVSISYPGAPSPFPPYNPYPVLWMPTPSHNGSCLALLSFTAGI